MDKEKLLKYIFDSRVQEISFNKQMALLDKDLLRIKKQKVKLGKMISKNMLHRNELIKQL